MVQHVMGNTFTNRSHEISPRSPPTSSLDPRLVLPGPQARRCSWRSWPSTENKYGIGRQAVTTYRFLQLSVFLLSMNEVQENVECARQHEGQEKAEPGKIHVPLSARPMTRQRTPKHVRTTRRTRTCELRHLTQFVRLSFLRA